VHKGAAPVASIVEQLHHPGRIGVGLGELGPGRVHHRVDLLAHAITARHHLGDVLVKGGVLRRR